MVKIPKTFSGGERRQKKAARNVDSDVESDEKMDVSESIFDFNSEANEVSDEISVETKPQRHTRAKKAAVNYKETDVTLESLVSPVNEEDAGKKGQLKKKNKKKGAGSKLVAPSRPSEDDSDSNHTTGKDENETKEGDTRKKIARKNAPRPLSDETTARNAAKNTRSRNAKTTVAKDSENDEDQQEHISAFAMREKLNSSTDNNESVSPVQKPVTYQEVVALENIKQISKLSNDQLKDRLSQLGIDCGPIVGTTRKTYEKSLQRALIAKAKSNKAAVKPSSDPEPKKMSKVKAKKIVEKTSKILEKIPENNKEKEKSNDPEDILEISDNGDTEQSRNKRAKIKRKALTSDSSADLDSSVDKKVPKQAKFAPEVKKTEMLMKSSKQATVRSTVINTKQPKEEHIKINLNAEVVEVDDTKTNELQKNVAICCKKMVTIEENLDSIEVGRRVLAHLISPVSTEDFFGPNNRLWEERPLHLRRLHAKNHFGNLFSTEQFFDILRRNPLNYDENINVARYVNDKRLTLNKCGWVDCKSVKEFLQTGCSVQFVNPQAYSETVWAFCDALQELFGCFVGANTYLTPANSAGFAPHWDDIDAFVCQVEGAKRWRLFKSNEEVVKWPTESSENLTENELTQNWTLIFDEWLNTGDLLYIPRGIVHMADTISDPKKPNKTGNINNHNNNQKNKKTIGQEDSLHVTISVGRKNTYGDLMKCLVPDILESLVEGESRTRRCLPVGIFRFCTGMAHLVEHIDEEEVDSDKTDLFNAEMSVVGDKLLDRLNDFRVSGVDMMARKFLRTALPPYFSTAEMKMSIFRPSGDPLPTITQKSQIRFIRRFGQRLIIETDVQGFVVHRMRNSRFYEGKAEQLFDLHPSMNQAFCRLETVYPKWMSVGDLSCDTVEQKLNLAELLFTNGLVLVK